MTQPLQVDIETAYAEACAALGESLTRERLLRRHIAALQDRLSRDEPAPADPVDLLTADVG